MWKHKESKWLVRGGRKVKCYLCGKKILAKGDLFLSHQDTGYYSHQSCQAESTTISGNERRRAVKKIAVGAAIATVIAAGAGKLIDISSQSKGSNSPAAQTILTSQGLIPPALTSDPSNPVPGQIWYRSDAGVEAHFDGVQNRVVYSSEINDGNVHVTSKGIVNGLSVLPNDGTGWFGPDTTKGATAPGQYGSPYTTSYGVAEAYDYPEATQLGSSGGSGVTTICFLPGLYLLHDDVTLDVGTTNHYGVNLIGIGGVDTVTILSDAPNGIVISPQGGAVSNDSYIVNMRFIQKGTSTINSLISFDDPNDYFSGSSLQLQDSYIITANSSTYAPANGGLYILSGVNVWMFHGGVFGANSFYYDGMTAGMMKMESVYIGQFHINEFQFLNTVSATFSDCFIGCIITIGASGSNFNNDVIFRGGFFNGQVYIQCDITTITFGPINVVGSALASSASLFQFLGGYTLQSLNIYDLTVGTFNYSIPFINSTNTVQNVKLLGNVYAGFGYNQPLVLPTPKLVAPSITNPPVSGTVYQNTNPYDIRLKIPVTYSPTSSAAATLATGISSTSTVTTSTKVSIPAGITAGEILTYDIVVPRNWYFEIVVTNATIGTAEVQAA